MTVDPVLVADVRAGCNLDVDVTVVVVTWRGDPHLRDCLESLRGQTLAHRLLIIDNDSDAATRAILADFPAADVRRQSRNLGFAGAIDAALPLIHTAMFALLNDDARAEPGWLYALRKALLSDNAAAVTSRMLLPDGSVNNSGVALTPDGYGRDRGLGESPESFGDRVEVFGFCGGAAIAHTDVVRSVGGFPARFFLYYEDTDTSWRLRLAGHRITYAPNAVVHHLHSASTDQRSESFARYNEVNRLRMLVRCAPSAVAARAAIRFILTTASLALQAVGGRAPDGYQFRVRVRIRIFTAVLRDFPRLLRERVAIPTSAADRRNVWRAWSCYSERPLTAEPIEYYVE